MKYTVMFLSASITGNFFGVVMYIFAIVIIVILAYFTTRFVAKAYSFGTKSRYMKLIDRVVLAPDKSVVLVELADKVYFIGSDKNGVSLLDTFDLETIKGFEQKGEMSDNKKSFLDYLNGKGKS